MENSVKINAQNVFGKEIIKSVKKVSKAKFFIFDAQICDAENLEFSNAEYLPCAFAFQNYLEREVFEKYEVKEVVVGKLSETELRLDFENEEGSCCSVFLEKII